MARIYVIGEKASGVLFVRTDPFRAVIVDEKAIASYAGRIGATYETVFGKIAGWATGFIASVDDQSTPDDSPGVPDAIAHRVTRGSNLSDADFCFVAGIANEDDWDAKRNSADIQPIASALQAIAATPSKIFSDTLPHVDLKSFVGRDRER